MAATDTTRPTAQALKPAFVHPSDTLYPAASVLTEFELRSLGRCAAGVGVILEILRADEDARTLQQDNILEADDPIASAPVLNMRQRDGLYCAALELADALKEIEDGHVRGGKRERYARDLARDLVAESAR